MTEIESRDGRTYFLNESGKAEYIIGCNGVRYYPYTYDSKYKVWTICSGHLSYKYFRRRMNIGKILFN